MRYDFVCMKKYLKKIKIFLKKDYKICFVSALLVSALLVSALLVSASLVSALLVSALLVASALLVSALLVCFACCVFFI